MKVETPKNDGGPAFPIETTATPYAPGMSLRDWFAGQALASMFDDGMDFFHSQGPKAAARWAYAFADAMMEARSK